MSAHALEIDAFGSLLATAEAVAGTPQAGSAAFLTWVRMNAQGLASVRASVPRETFYRHLRVIRAAGLPLPAQSAKRPSEADQAGAALLSLPGRRVKLRRGAPCAPEGGTGEVYEVLFRHGRWWVELAIDPPASCPDAHAVDFAELDMGEFKRWAEICDE